MVLLIQNIGGHVVTEAALQVTRIVTVRLVLIVVQRMEGMEAGNRFCQGRPGNRED